MSDFLPIRDAAANPHPEEIRVLLDAVGLTLAAVGRAEGLPLIERIKLAGELASLRVELVKPGLSLTARIKLAGRLADVRKRLGEAKKPAVVDSAPVVPPPLVTYTTAKGKELHGFVRTDLTKEQAQAIDPYTFRHGDGWFIREQRAGGDPAAAKNPVIKVGDVVEFAGEGEAVLTGVAVRVNDDVAYVRTAQGGGFTRPLAKFKLTGKTAAPIRGTGAEALADASDGLEHGTPAWNIAQELHWQLKGGNSKITAELEQFLSTESADALWRFITNVADAVGEKSHNGGDVRRAAQEVFSGAAPVDETALLVGIPGAKFVRGKGLIQGQYGVEVGGEIRGGYHVKPEDAVSDAVRWLKMEADKASAAADRTAALASLRTRLESGGEPTEQDLRLLNLRADGADLEFFIPAAAELFGISARAVRPKVMDLIRAGHTDMGVKRESVNPKAALMAMSKPSAVARPDPAPAPTPTPDPLTAESKAPSAADLESFGLLRKWGDRWQYKNAISGGMWLTSNSKDGAVEQAAVVFAKTKESDRLTQAQRGELANQERMDRVDLHLKSMTIPELEAKLVSLDAQLASLQAAGRREFNGNGARRTAAAVSNEGARTVGQEKMDLAAYIEWRKAKEALGAAVQPDPVVPPPPKTIDEALALMRARLDADDAEGAATALSGLTVADLRSALAAIGHHAQTSAKKSDLIAVIKSIMPANTKSAKAAVDRRNKLASIADEFDSARRSVSVGLGLSHDGRQTHERDDVMVAEYSAKMADAKQRFRALAAGDVPASLARRFPDLTNDDPVPSIAAANDGKDAANKGNYPAPPPSKPGLAGLEQIARIYIDRGEPFENFSVGIRAFYRGSHEFMGGPKLDVQKLTAALEAAGFNSPGALKQFFQSVGGAGVSTPRQVAIDIAKAHPGGDVMELREMARKAIVAQFGASAAEEITHMNFMRGDDLTQAIHDGQYELVREFAASMPTPVRESDIPRDSANRAHNGTSYSPEKRGQSEQRSYVRGLADAWKQAQRAAGVDPAAQQRIAEVLADVVPGYRNKVLGALAAKSQVMSSMIAGGGNFPVRSNQKRSDTADKRSQEASEYLAAGIKRMLKAARGPIDNSPASELERVQKNLAEREKAQEKMKAANVAVRKGDDQALRDLGFTPEQIANLKKPDFAGRVGFADYHLTNNNAEIRRLKERLKEVESRATAAEVAPVKREFNGVRIEENAQDDRLRLFFDGKPGDEVRTDLKANGFKWSPMAGAWQRQLTDNARRAADAVLKKHFPSEPAVAADELASQL